MGKENGCKIYQRRRDEILRKVSKKVDVIDERIKNAA